MLGEVVLGLVSLVVLIAGSEKIVGHAVTLMERRGISGSFIGLAVISVGTSLPEMLTHVVASADILGGRIDPVVASATVLGTNVGSDIAQQNLLLGIVALAGALAFTKTLLYRDFAIMVGVAALVMAFGWDGWLSRAEGAALVTGYLIYLVRVYQSRARDDGIAPEADAGTEVWRHWIWIVGGLVAIVLAGHFVLQAAEHLVRRSGLGGSLIGVGVIGLATSLPELSTALASIRKGQSELSVGTLVGSNITNPMLALGLGMVISGYSAPDVVIEFDLPVKIGTAGVIFAFLLSGKRLSRLESGILIGFYVSYLASRIWLYPDDVSAHRPELPESRTGGSLAQPARPAIDFAGEPARVYIGPNTVLERCRFHEPSATLPRIESSWRESDSETETSLEKRKLMQGSESIDGLEGFRLAEAAGGVGTWDWNVADDACVSSEETGRLYGLEPGEPLSYQLWIERVHPDDRERVDRAVQEALSGAGRYDVEYRVRLPEGDERWLWARGIVTFDGGGDPLRVVGVHIDLTSRKRVEREREQAEAASRKASELKDDFLAMLGHELRNPIGAIANGIELLRSDTAREHRPWAEEMIERQTLQLKRLVDDILEVSRVARGQLEIRPEVMSLSACVETARDALRERLTENPREFDVRLPEERIHLFVDPARMQQILGNVLLNAIKYTDAGGRIGLSAERQGDRIVIRVEDDGEGLTEEHRDVIFEPFVRVSQSLRRAGSGLGIGLTLVKNLVELHGGTVTVRSPGPAKGCTFTVELPVHDGEAANESVEPAGAAQPLRILVVDDNRDLAQGLQRRLTRQGHDVTLAHDGPQGLAAARRTKPDVVLVDIGLPSMDGYEVASKLREDASPGMRLAAISGFKERGEDEAAAEAFDHYFLKPVDAEQLQAWLIRVSEQDDGAGS